MYTADTGPQSPILVCINRHPLHNGHYSVLLLHFLNLIKKKKNSNFAYFNIRMHECIYMTYVRLLVRLPASDRLDGFRVFAPSFRRLAAAAAANDDSPPSPVRTLCARVRRCTPRGQ